MTTLRGKVSWFGGPDDMGVAPDEDLAFIYEVSDAPELFLDEQPPDTTGLARRLDPDTFYIAMRWDYDATSRSELLDMRVRVRAVRTGEERIASPADWGPNDDTGRVADISPGLMDALGIGTDEEVEIEFPYRGENDMSNDVPVCLDLSHHNGYPDFEEVKAAGVRGCIFKATEGSSFIDPARAENASNAKKAGLGISTYFWLKPGDGREQAEFYLSVIDPVPGERVVIDYEEDGCSLTTLKDAVQALLDYKQDLKITVYSGHLLKQELDGDCDDFLATNTDLWLAEYQSDSTLDDISWPDETYPQWTLHQYSETGEVPGIDDAYVDLDRFNGNDQEFVEWISPAGALPPKPEPPSPEPDERVVSVAITAPDDVKVEVSVNEQKIMSKKKHRLLRALRAVRRGPDITR